MKIRPEEPGDFDQIYELNAAAFGGEDEAKLVDKLRALDGYISLVAIDAGPVVGHISFSPVTLNDEPTAFTGLAPMSVKPDRQRTGIGSALVTAGLEACRQAGHTAVFALGHANYYPRFGFRTAADMGFACEYPVEPEYFMALELAEGAFDDKRGLIRYDPAFAGF